MNKVAMIYTTVDSINHAEKLAHLAISEKVAACVNIIPQGRSIYFWEGAINQADECYLLFKTSFALSDTLVSWLKKNHPYDIPAILQIIAESTDDFSSYLHQSLNHKS